MRANKRRQVIEDDDDEPDHVDPIVDDTDQAVVVNDTHDPILSQPDEGSTPALLSGDVPILRTLHQASGIPGLLHERTLNGHFARSEKWRAWHWGNMKQVSEQAVLKHVLVFACTSA